MVIQRRCVIPGCTSYAIRDSRCRKHGRKAWRTSTASPTKRGYGADWRKARDAYIADHPTCEWATPHGPCKAPGTSVDHVVPLAHGGARLSTSNMQTLCTHHKKVKDAMDSRAGLNRKEQT